LTHFDEYGLLDFGQWVNPAQQSWNQRQFEMGVGSGAMNAVFGAARLGNYAIHSLSGMGFGSNYHSMNSWLDQTQSSFTQRFFPQADYNASSFKWGSFCGDFAAGSAIGGYAFSGARNLASAFGNSYAFSSFAQTSGRILHSGPGTLSNLSGRISNYSSPYFNRLATQSQTWKLASAKVAPITKSSSWQTDAHIANDWAQLSGILRLASRGKGNIGLGTGTREQANALGKVWVGEGHRISSDGTAWISSNGMRQYRPPSFKMKLDKVQANFERKFEGQTWNNWPFNGHLDILD
jgi:hypothetical protein